MELNELLNNLYNKKLIAIGETHHGLHTSFFKELGNYINQFNGVFIEMPVSDQPSVEHCLNNGDFDDRLWGLITGAKSEGKDIEGTTKAILDYGKTVPIICIDSSKQQTAIYKNKSGHGYYFHKGYSREEDMFNNIHERYKESERWILINGARHLEIGKHQVSKVDTLGTRLMEKFGNELYRICLITNEDSAEKASEVICKVVDQSAKGYLAKFDAYIITP